MNIIKIIPEIIIFLFVLISMFADSRLGHAANPVTSGASYADVPDKIDTAKKYLFYMHGVFVELRGPDAVSKQHGRYMYDDIVKTFVSKGFIVISEVRSADTKIDDYSRKVVRQIQRLIDAGVHPQNITVIGHSKGGALTLATSAGSGNPKLNFVVMAGCGIGKFANVHNLILQRYAPRLQGRILSLYDSADDEAASCQEDFKLASNIESREIVFKTGLGHGLFYAPRREWVDAVIDWAYGR